MILNIEISVVREVFVPLEAYPYVRRDEPISKAISHLLSRISADGGHLHFDDMFVIDDEGRLIGTLPIRNILEKFFSSVLRPSSSCYFFDDCRYFGDMVVVVDEWFKSECHRLSEVTVEQYMSLYTVSVDASMHVIQALGIMLKNEKNVLPVTEDNVLRGAVRMEDIFKILGAYCTHLPHATNTIFKEGKLS
jgi:CBS domain-containing protein